MKKTLFLLISLSIISCRKPYEKEEFYAIQNILNDYLKREYLENEIRPYIHLKEETNSKFNTDSTEIKVYISDALIPISQIKEDEYWMFINNYSDPENKKIFKQIINSDQFKKLRYREIDKKNIKLINPYKQAESSIILLKNKEKYHIFNFSRVCFDNQKKNGIIVLNESIGKNGLEIQGNYKALLIKKKNKKWTYIKENQNNLIIETDNN